MRILKFYNSTVLKLAALLLFIFVFNVGTFAQCAMCKASVESDLANGGSIAQKLNTGILYLMAVPYIILMVGTYFFFKKAIDFKIKAWRDKHFPNKRTS